MNKKEKIIKILLVGDTNVGKTCFRIRYVDGYFDQSYLTTVGMDYKLKTLKFDDKKIKLQIWNTVGQERFRSIQKNYYKGTHGFILIYDITSKKSLDDIRKFIDMINKEASDKAQKILVGNKVDKEESREVTKEEGEKLAKEFNLPFFECSSKENININEVFDVLVKKIIENFEIEEQNIQLKKNKNKISKNKNCS